MKLPLEGDPFAPVENSPEQEASLENLAKILLNETIVEWEHFAHVQKRVLDPKRWRPIKTRERMTVYRDAYHGTREPVPVYPGTLSTVGMDDSNRGLRVLGVGAVVGNLDDFLLGTTTLTADQMRIRRSYNDDECVDYRVLSAWRRPTVDEPFLFHSLRWYVKAVPAAQGVVKPRDMVLLDCVGVHEMPNGQRVGYLLLHSVDIPECREISGLIRCHISACYIFVQNGPNSVEVYLRSIVQPGGMIVDSVASFSTANALISTWKLPWVGQNRKLAWIMIQSPTVKAERLGKKAIISTRKNKCSLCSKSITLLRRTSVCELCLESVCSRCITVRKLSFIRHNGDMVQMRTAFCKNCIMWSTKMDSADIARILFVFEGKDTQVSHDSSLGGGAFASRSVPQMANEDYAMLSDDSESLDVETVYEWEISQRQANQDTLSQSVSLNGSEKSQDSNQLLKQMNQLVLAAEQTYQLTQQNSEAMVQST